jgi:uncharacterized protein with HEPN domain
MRRELLLIGEMIDAATQAQSLVAGTDLEALQADRQRRDALLWNFTVLGEAATQHDDEVKGRFPDIPWAQPARLRNRVIHGYWSIDLRSCIPRRPISCLASSTSYGTLSSSSRPTRKMDLCSTSRQTHLPVPTYLPRYALTLRERASALGGGWVARGRAGT